MKKALIIASGVLAALALYVGAFLVANHNVAGSAADVTLTRAEALPQAGETLDVMAWNLGYGGLGARSDFVADGGGHLFPPSKADVRANVAAISETIAAQDADVFLFEEMAHDGPVNYWVNLKARVDETLRGRDRVFYSDFRTRLLPWPLRIDHGQGVYSRYAIAGADLKPLPAEDGGFIGVRRRYASTVARLDIQGREKGWTIAVVHLAAFDADATVRTRQLHELMAWAQREYESGQHVVLGGDWNFQLAETNFPHTTEDKFLFWLFPFPQDALPAGWRVAADPSIASVRTNERPYVRGENYTTVIDGFIVSPNVAVEEVHGVALDFQHSDHQPVRARFRVAD